MERNNLLTLLGNHGLLSANQINQVTWIAKTKSVSYVKILLERGFLSRQAYQAFLANLGYGLVDVKSLEYDVHVLSKTTLEAVQNTLHLPLIIENNVLKVAVANPLDGVAIAKLKADFNLEIEIVVVSDLGILWLAHKILGQALVESAVYDLMDRDAESSAVITFTKSQLKIIFIIIAAVVVSFFLDFVTTVLIFNIITGLFFLFANFFKLALVLIGSKLELFEAVRKNEVDELSESSLPPYTILLPVYKESQLLRKLFWRMDALDYPKHQLDIKLLVEEDDIETFEALNAFEFATNFETIFVPHHLPKTKPKACNYGIHFAIGEYLTIYDAEDIPDIDQLKKSIALFRKLPKDFICIQASLNYFNKNENFLTKMFTLEYSYWFDYMLPGLERMSLPIPLGGTSNHFVTEKLRELGKWDPFNVTEDADLGIRAFAKGYKVALLNSTTYEEANNEYFNWIRQRSRWIKGYMQTYLVHMRNPFKLIKKVGFKGFFAFNFFIGAIPVTFIAYPILICLFIIYLFFDGASIKEIFPPWVMYISLFNFFAGNMLIVYINMVAVFKRRYYGLILLATLNPVYWLLHSISAYKALWQLIYNPFYWEKTVHGLTKIGFKEKNV